MKIIQTHNMEPTKFDAWTQDQVYNGLDVCITADVLDALIPQMDDHTRATYAFSRELQGPVLEMRLRGCLIDAGRKVEVIDEFWELLELYESYLNRIVFEGVGMPVFNWRSNKDLSQLFYSELSLPTQRHGHSVTTDRGAREKLEIYPVATIIARLINTLAELGDKISVLRTEIDPDGRIRTSYNIAGTSTGRFSSSLSEFGTGGNLQNVEESLRSIFISDPGYKLAKFDAKSGESFIVGAIEWNQFHDDRFLEACNTGDPHTAVARLCWPNLGWTGDLNADKKLAEQPFYRHLSYRDACKRIGHGSNYLGGPQQISDETRVPVDIVTNFQRLYFKAFPAHRLWHEHCRDTLRRTGTCISLMGRKRNFHRRRLEEKTLKEYIAYNPQSSLADIVNRGMLNTWRHFKATGDPVCVMFQDHDATTWMYPEELEDTIIPVILKHLNVPVELADGKFLEIPYDCEVGWNKGKHSAEKNPDGLKKYSGHDDRDRTPQVGLLDRVFRKTHRAGARPGNLAKVDGNLGALRGARAKGLGQDHE